MPNPSNKTGQLEGYAGPLSPEMIAAGMNAALRNATRLAGDAQFLLERKSYATAASLAALSIEESGKITVLRGLAVAKSPQEIKAEWRRYRDHRSKNGMWILTSLYTNGARTLKDFAKVVERDGEHTALLNTLKQLGFYTDCYDKALWAEPENLFNEDLAKTLVEVATILAKPKSFSIREVELWIQHLSPVWRTPDMANGILLWAEAMVQEGLGETTASEYAKFITGECLASKGSK